MPVSILDKLAGIIDQIDRSGNAELTRLTVLKKWFERPGRLGAFALWVAACAASRGIDKDGPAGELSREVDALLAVQKISGALHPAAAADLYHRLREIQNTYQRLRWGSVRIIEEPDLFLVEEGLAVYLWGTDSPARGYKLAAAYCEHYDPHYGNGLNGPSRNRIEAIAGFIEAREAHEAGSAPGMEG